MAGQFFAQESLLSNGQNGSSALVHLHRLLPQAPLVRPPQLSRVASSIRDKSYKARVSQFRGAA
uniref:Uncharacterized protein n=1 Tax=Leersia perrieri TaxID=77586 RepID=A0A0D9WNN0_9ORYZ